jgi:ADP-ribosylglycohydrolase
MPENLQKVMQQNDQIKNCFLGLAIGDAFGAGVEFQGRDWLRERIDGSKWINMLDPERSKDYKSGEYTDDAEMTFGLVKAILSEEKCSAQMFYNYWHQEYLNKKQENGIGRHGHGAIKKVYNESETLSQIQEFQASREDPGCGATMRVLPLGFLPEDQLKYYAIESAKATHPHPKAITSALVMSYTARYFIEACNDQEKIFEHILNNITNQDTDSISYLKKIQDFPHINELNEDQYSVLCGPQPLQSPVKGIYGVPSSAMHVMGVSLLILRDTKNTFEGLINSIHVGGDFDSVASLVTGVLAIRYGLDSLPNYLLQEVEGAKSIVELAEKYSDFLLL